MKKKLVTVLLMITVLTGMVAATGCGNSSGKDGKIHINLVQYKPEAVKAFEKMEEEFNATHDDIVLEIESPNDAMTVLKTRFIKEDVPDIIGIGGDVNFSSFIDSDMLMDISDFEGISDIKPAYLKIAKNLEYVPEEGVYSVPYVANAAGILYNKDMFDEHNWDIPTTWDEFIALCDEIQASGIQPLYFGFKDTWTCLAPWNSLAVDLAPADVCQQVNRGETTFSDEYREVSEKMLELLPYGPEDPYAYNYNDACTAFANGESAMYTIGNYAVPQIQSVNPDMNIDSFVMPGNNNADVNILNSGIDLQFCVTNDCENKEAAYEVLRYLLKDETIQIYLNDQSAVPCKEGDFELPEVLNGMASYIKEGKMADYQDHYYPAEMSVDAQIQTFLINGDVNAFLKKFDSDWERYNRDIIRKVQEYEENGGNE
ncbi:ABC transporter substrate-binding protein [Faecalicatena contorta]|uniref:ABC transporter substrate-binding protein n=1 Tax=Lachnospiraceae TaxID=186803 RepID=UPI001F35FA11|nr:extracellular solute-binding protein [Faecalicatena contorta]MCF2669150.1 extracellular solute-binding protein [Faecalicatena contorta]